MGECCFITGNDHILYDFNDNIYANTNLKNNVEN